MPSGSLTQPSDATVWFANRQEAGDRLATVIASTVAANPPKVARWIVYALPRGGVIVAAPIAQRLHCPLDVIVAKKITRPENPELAMGAVTADGHPVWLPGSRSTGAPDASYQLAVQQAREQAVTQAQQFASSRPGVNPTGAIALVVDDGIATGMTMVAAVTAIRAQHPSEVWIAIPVAPLDVMAQLDEWAERVIVLATPSSFVSVSRFYGEFQQVGLDDAIATLRTTNLP